MNFYLVKYEGLWLGGTAVVAADSPEDALELVEKHEETTQFRDPRNGMVPVSTQPTVTPISVPGPCVLYNDNGDY